MLSCRDSEGLLVEQLPAALGGIINAILVPGNVIRREKRPRPGDSTI
jgi:hypothetical protein